LLQLLVPLGLLTSGAGFSDEGFQLQVVYDDVTAGFTLEELVEGNLGVYILERREGEVTHFIILTFWESLEAIRRFAGDDPERAKYYDEDKDFLLEFEPKVLHYEVVGQS